jgi:hypothetical protein
VIAWSHALARGRARCLRVRVFLSRVFVRHGAARCAAPTCNLEGGVTPSRCGKEDARVECPTLSRATAHTATLSCNGEEGRGAKMMEKYCNIEEEQK